MFMNSASVYIFEDRNGRPTLKKIIFQKIPHIMGSRLIVFKTSALYPLRKTYRLIPLSGRSISQDSTFKCTRSFI
jgi:hypothetical protein